MVNKNSLVLQPWNDVPTFRLFYPKSSLVLLVMLFEQLIGGWNELRSNECSSVTMFHCCLVVSFLFMSCSFHRDRVGVE